MKVLIVGAGGQGGACASILARQDAIEEIRLVDLQESTAKSVSDMDKAVDVLRTRGLAAAAKKVGRATNEGTVMAIVSDDATKGAVVETGSPLVVLA